MKINASHGNLQANCVGTVPALTVASTGSQGTTQSPAISHADFRQSLVQRHGYANLVDTGGCEVHENG
jgi:hypothetical protein